MYFNINFLANVFTFFSCNLLLFFAFKEYKKLRDQKVGEEKKVEEISKIIKQAAITYLFAQFKVLLIVEIFITLLLAIFSTTMSLSFLCGAMLSWISGFISMYVSVSYNYKVALLAKKGFKQAFEASFSVGKVVGLLVTGIALTSCYVISFLPSNLLFDALTGFSFGACLISIFARIGGGIFTKGADIGADLVGKLEKGIPEDDPRNPAVIADALGDNIGDACGMAADLFESYIVIFSAAMFIAFYSISKEFLSSYYTLILVVLASGALASVITLNSGWNYKEDAKIASLGISLKTLFISFVVLSNSFGMFFSGMPNVFAAFLCAFLGLISASLIMPLTEYYTAGKFRPIKSLVEASKQGHATNVIQGIAIGLEATFYFLIMLISSIVLTYSIDGIMGVAISCLAMISVCPVILALDAFGPVTDNAGGLVEMGNLSDSVRKVTDELDTIGNMTKATTKGYAVYTAGLATLVFSRVYQFELSDFFKKAWIMDINNVFVLIGMFSGAAVVVLFCAYCLLAVNNASMAIMNEVRSQFEEFPGIMEGTQQPLYSKAIDILTEASLKEMVFPALLPVISTFSLFFLANVFSGDVKNGFLILGGFILSITVSGIIFAVSMTVSGGAWDNAKKFIEASNEKGSEAHKAAITGDTVGDPYKDTAGPSLNPMIKLVGVLSVLITTIFRIGL